MSSELVHPGILSQGSAPWELTDIDRQAQEGFLLFHRRLVLGHSLDVKLFVANLLPQSSGDGAVRQRASINVFKTKESILTISHIILEVGEGASVIFLIKQLILIISPAGSSKSPQGQTQKQTDGPEESLLALMIQTPKSNQSKM